MLLALDEAPPRFYHRLLNIGECRQVIDSCLAKSSAQPTDGRSGSFDWIDLKKKMLRKRSCSHCSHVPDPSGPASVESQHCRACVWHVWKCYLPSKASPDKFNCGKLWNKTNNSYAALTKQARCTLWCCRTPDIAAQLLEEFEDEV